MGLWNLVPACDFEYFYSRLDEDYPIDNYDGFNDTVAVPAELLDPGVLGVTFMVNDGPLWFDLDVVFSDFPNNVGYNFDPDPDCDVITSPTPDNGYSFFLVATHEMGHALGMGHDPIGTEPAGSPWFIATMNPRYPSGGPVGQENIVELHTDDRNGARFLYPHSGPSDPPFVDLALPGYTTGDVIGKAVPLFFSPASIYPGDELSLRSVIENLGTTNEFYVRQGFYLSSDELIDTTDQLIGDLTWDIAFEDALEFGVGIDMPEDIEAGDYTVGAIIDDLDEVVEEYEDNNAVAYCSLLTVSQLVPVINAFDQEIIPCGQLYVSDVPTVTHPLNMSPITWSLDNPEPGMTIHPATGLIIWPDPIPSPFLYTIRVRATNDAGTSTETLFLGVEASVPQIVPIPDQTIACQSAYVGPTPVLTSPTCMNPILDWSLDIGPQGMTIDHATGVVSCPSVPSSPVPHLVTIRATNAVGSVTTSWTLQARAGDLGGDGSVNLSDFTLFETCFSGPDGAVGSGCECGDADLDGDIDLADFQVFQTVFGG
jgi:hypothetical protein